MLRELHIRDLGVIEDATLPLAPGLTVVAGETCSSREVSIDLAEKERIEHMPARVRQRHGLQSTALWPECGTHIRMGKRMSLGRV